MTDHEQPRPTPNDGPIVQREVIEDMELRLTLGIERYGTGLQIGNGRSMLRDAYDEALDLATYLRGEMDTRVEIGKVLRHLVELHSCSSAADALDNTYYCTRCTSEPYPCHTHTDIVQALALLGEEIDNGDS